MLLVSLPRSERVPPLIFRLTTGGRRLRSAALLSALTFGNICRRVAFFLCCANRFPDRCRQQKIRLVPRLPSLGRLVARVYRTTSRATYGRRIRFFKSSAASKKAR